MFFSCFFNCFFLTFFPHLVRGNEADKKRRKEKKEKTAMQTSPLEMIPGSEKGEALAAIRERKKKKQKPLRNGTTPRKVDVQYT